MGAIDLASAKVPKSTKDGAVDLVTRQYLFEKGLNFRHGTGHGIGAYLKVSTGVNSLACRGDVLAHYFKVHEGPIIVGMNNAAYSLTGSFVPGMFFSDEPGYYEDGAFGIRLETILRVVSMNTSTNDFGNDTMQEARKV